LGADVINWNRRSQLGKVFSSSTVFKLPDGRQTSPDVAWVERSRWEALSQEERRKFPPLAPDFVIELKSETDRLPKLQTKMQEYRGNGVRLGWLIGIANLTISKKWGPFLTESKRTLGQLKYLIHWASDCGARLGT
jgi:Uma2 family endonuclease